MSEATKRLRRKDLREPDEFFTLTGRALDWARKNRQLAIGLSAGLALIVIAVGAVTWWRQWREERAAREFYGASELFRREQWDAAEKSFADLAASLGGTPYGRIACVYAGRAALRAGRNTDAAQYFEEYLRSPVPDAAVEQLAHLNLGIARAAAGDPEAARREVEAAMVISGPAKGEATLELARLEEAAGARDRALELYQRYLEDQPDGVARDLARARVVALGGTPPAAPAGFPGSIPPISLQ